MLIRHKEVQAISGHEESYGSDIGNGFFNSVEPQSIATGHRSKRIREKTESLSLVLTRLDTATKFDFTIKDMNFMHAQMICLENEVGMRSSNRRRLYGKKSSRRRKRRRIR